MSAWNLKPLVKKMQVVCNGPVLSTSECHYSETLICTTEKGALRGETFTQYTQLTPIY